MVPNQHGSIAFWQRVPLLETVSGGNVGRYQVRVRPQLDSGQSEVEFSRTQKPEEETRGIEEKRDKTSG